MSSSDRLWRLEMTFRGSCFSSFLGDYGLGRTVKTFTLLPGETAQIHTRTRKATQESISQASSIIDSYDESSSERFAETVLAETTDTATREKSENWHVEADAKASIGIASAMRDLHSTPVPVLEQVLLNKCGTDFQVRDAQPNDNRVYPPPTANGRLYYRFKHGPLGQSPQEENPVDGVVMSERTLIMATDSVVVEALLGQSPALDDYSEELQIQAIREKKLANDQQELALHIYFAHVYGGSVDNLYTITSPEVLVGLVADFASI